MTEIPEGYWSSAPHGYYRDHGCMGWGVMRGMGSGDVVVTGLDKSVAAAVACLLNGDVAYARTYLEGLPDRLGG